MSKFVLFSPIGASDPIRELYDGPMLHIVRHYKPHKVYLYYTKEMTRKREEIIKALASFDIMIEEIITDIADPHDFDIFAKTFDEIFIKIQKENQDSSILLNISSGTPQIKSSLCLEVISSHLKLKPIQVSTPAKGSNENIAHGGGIEENLDDLMENGEYIAPNRCIETNILSFKRASIKRDTTSLLGYYEYRAALKILEGTKELFDIDAIELVRYAMLRQNDNKEYRKSEWHKTFNYTKDIQAKAACDYYCILSNKAKSGELSYFILLLQSLTEHLAENYIGEITEEKTIEILNLYYKKEYEKPYKPKYAKVDNKWQIVYNLEQHIAKMEYKQLSTDVILKFKEISDQLKSRRNNLAHGLYREDDINPNKSLKTLRYLIAKTFGNKVKESSLNLYENINKKIIEIL